MCVDQSPSFGLREPERAVSWFETLVWRNRFEPFVLAATND